MECESGTESCGGDFDNSVDMEKMRPVARLGYGQEYTVILELLERRNSM